MADDRGLQGALNSFTGSIGRSSPASPLDAADDALLLQMDDFFAAGKNTERIRRFIESNDDALTLIATEDGSDTNSPGGLQLYQLFQRYAALIEGIVEDFVASLPEKETDVLASLVAAIQKEWNASENAYRLLCTSYIAASLDYEAFLEFAQDQYGTMHYSMAADDDLENAESLSSSSGSSFDFDGTVEKAETPE